MEGSPGQIWYIFDHWIQCDTFERLKIRHYFIIYFLLFYFNLFNFIIIELSFRYHICAATCYIVVGIVIICRRAFNYIYIEPLVVGIVILLGALFSVSIKTPKATIICTSIRKRFK